MVQAVRVVLITALVEARDVRFLSRAQARVFGMTVGWEGAAGIHRRARTPVAPQAS